MKAASLSTPTGQADSDEGVDVGERVPTTVIEALTGYPQVGVSEIIIPLLTVDIDGYPNVCLLSRAQVDADAEHVYAVVAGLGTKSNILSNRHATLIIFTTGVVHYCKMDAASLSDQGNLLCAVFTIASTKVDGNGSLPVEAPRYIPTEAVVTFEDWGGSRAILSALKTHQTTREP